MAEIKVTPSILRNKADALKGLNSKFRTEVGNMVGYEQRLSESFEGEAQREFHKAFNDDKQKMDIFASNIDTYVQALLDSAEQYEQAEQKNLTTASTRKA